jgi:hypothetical protein
MSIDVTWWSESLTCRQASRCAFNREIFDAHLPLSGFCQDEKTLSERPVSSVGSEEGVSSNAKQNGGTLCLNSKMAMVLI